MDALLLYAELVQRLGLRVDVKLVAEDDRICHEEDDDPEYPDAVESYRWYVSDQMEAAADSGYSESDTWCSTVQAVLPHFELLGKRLVWLNDDSSSCELAASYLPYADYGHSGSLYTELAMLVHVPPYQRERVAEAAAEAVNERGASKAERVEGEAATRKRGRSAE